MAYAKINNVTNANMAKVSSVAKAAIGKIASIDAPSSFNSYSISFDGVNDHATMHGTPVSGAVGSVSFWFRIDSLGSTEYLCIFENDSSNYMRIWFYNNTNKIFGQLYADGTIRGPQSDAISIDTWYHLAFTWSDASAADELKLYINGTQQGGTFTGNGTFSGTPDKIHMGSDEDPAQKNWRGDIDEFAIFSDVLTSGEVTAIYNSGVPKDESSHSGLTGYWRMEEGSGTEVADSSTNSNVLTLVNGTAFDSDTP